MLKFLENRRAFYLFVFWPLIPIAFMIIVLLFITLIGCEFSALDSSECIVFGTDIGEWIYPFWAVGYLAAFSLVWIVPAAFVWLVVREILRPGNPE